MIRHLKHHEIDKLKWDDRIKSSRNCKICGYSWYLDIVSPGWEALIFNEYEAVMPLTLKQKFGFNYLVQPILSQQLGVFYSNNETPFTDFYRRIFQEYLYINICVNTNPDYLVESTKIIPHNNYILNMNHSYERLYDAYTANHKKNIKRAQKRTLEILPCEQEECISFLEKGYFELLGINSILFTNYRKILAQIPKVGNVKFYGVYKKTKLIASLCCPIVYNNMNKLSISSTEGKREGALYLLIDHVIRENSGRNLLFDFGGSDVQSIAYFFSGFGPSVETYSQVKYSKVMPGLLFKLIR